jgi:hypothetical protein
MRVLHAGETGRVTVLLDDPLAGATPEPQGVHADGNLVVVLLDGQYFS